MDSRRIKDVMIWILDEIHRDKETISTRLSYPRSSLIYLITRNKNHQKVCLSIYAVVFTVYATRLNYLFDWFTPQFNLTRFLRSFESTFLSNNLWTTSSLETGLKVSAGNDSKIVLVFWKSQNRKFSSLSSEWLFIDAYSYQSVSFMITNLTR